MTPFYVHDGVYLVRRGICPTSMIPLQKEEGEYARAGLIECGDAPFIGARFNVKTRQWDDLRTDGEKAEASASEVLAMRRTEYPDIAELADALYWKSQGDESHMQAYFAACAAVKKQFPKE